MSHVPNAFDEFAAMASTCVLLDIGGGHRLGVCAAEKLHVNFRHFQGCLPPSLHRGNRLWRVLRGRKIVCRFSFLLPRRLLAPDKNLRAFLTA